MQDVRLDGFKEFVEKDGIVLVDFWAAWCGPCRTFGPVFEAAEKSHPGVRFGKVDVDAEQQLAGALGIRAIPTLMVLRDGVLVFSQPGALSAGDLDRLIEEVGKLDMNDVRQKIAEEHAGHAHGEHGHGHAHAGHDHDHDHGEHGHAAHEHGGHVHAPRKSET